MADTKVSALTAVSTLDGSELVPVVQSGTSKRATVADIRGTIKAVSTDQSSTSTTGTAISALTTSLTPGTYLVKVWAVWQSTAVGTGIGLWLNCSGGTVTRNVGHVYTLTTGTTATTGVADQASAAGTFQTVEARAWRANNTDPGPFGGVDTVNADQFSVLEAVVIVTATTSLQVMFDTETAGTGVSIQEGTTLEVHRAA